MYHVKVWPSFAQQQCLQQGAQGGDFTDVHLSDRLGAMLQHELQTLLHILLKQLQQVCSHGVWELERQREGSQRDCGTLCSDIKETFSYIINEATWLVRLRYS